MVFPFHRASQKTDSPRSHGRITTVIALFLMALLAGGLFFQNTALKKQKNGKKPARKKWSNASRRIRPAP